MSGKFVLSSGHLDPGWDGDADQGEVTLPLQGRQVKLSLARGLEIGVSQHLPRDLDINLDSNIVFIMIYQAMSDLTSGLSVGTVRELHSLTGWLGPMAWQAGLAPLHPSYSTPQNSTGSGTVRAPTSSWNREMLFKLGLTPY